MSGIGQTECNLELALLLYFSREFHEISNRRFTLMPQSGRRGFSFESFHEQLPLPVPCYDLLPVTELTVFRKTKFGYSRLP